MGLTWVLRVAEINFELMMAMPTHTLILGIGRR